MCPENLGSAWRIDRPFASSGLEPALATFVRTRSGEGSFWWIVGSIGSPPLLRQCDLERKMRVLRGSKVLCYRRVTSAGLGSAEAVHTRDELSEMTTPYGIRSLVIRDKPYGYEGVARGSYPKIAETVREFLRSDPLALVQEFFFDGCYVGRSNQGSGIRIQRRPSAWDSHDKHSLARDSARVSHRPE